MTGLLAALTLFLSLVGVYGVARFAMARRTREIGIRIALGAAPRDVVMLCLSILRGPASLGVGAGAVLAVFASWWLRYARLVPGGGPDHHWTIAAAVLVVLGVVLLAAVVPAVSTARRDPSSALRSD